MPIEPGQQFLQYRLTEKIGEGGMGVVWRAEDTKLGRDVALKFLTETFAADAERLARFEREAKLLAALNHANIATIHGLEEAEGLRFLVLELVPGEDLAARLKGGPLPVPQTVAICRQLTEALDAAHERGIFHRDLKPANIKLTPEGSLKVLDFGLAKAWETDTVSGDLSESPTLTHQMTRVGVILGTAAYMSPEQARGRTTDKRTDIWSFGCILFELLSGRTAFSGDTVSDNIAAILKGEPEWSALPATTPPRLKELMIRCLEKDRRRRLRDIGDARVELEKVEAGDTGTAKDAAPGRRGLPLWTALIFVPLLIAAGVGLAWMFRAQAPETPTIYMGLPIPDRVDAVLGGDLSQDGQRIAFIGRHRPAEGAGPEWMDTAIYVRELNSPEARRLPGTEHARSVMFSPSGARLFFTTMDRLRPTGTVQSLPVEGGSTLTVFEFNTQRSLLNGFDWFVAGEDELLVMAREGRALYRVTTSGGEPQLVSKLEPEWPDGNPHPDSESFGRISLPRADGRFALLTGRSASGPHTSLWRVNLETGETSLVLDNAALGRETDDGRLWFVRNKALFVAPFDLDRAEVTGPAQLRLSGLGAWLIDRAGDRMVYVVASELIDQESIVLVDPSGQSETLVDGADYSSPRVSPDGRRLAYQIDEDTEARIWVREIDSGLARAITPEGEFARGPRWTPDGRLAYNKRMGEGSSELLVRDPTPAATPEPVLPWEGSGPGPGIGDPSFSPDGRFVIVDSTPQNGQEGGLYLYDVGDGDSGRPFFATEGWEGGAAIRPDGLWVAYQANASGGVEVYLRRLVPQDPDSAPIHAVTNEGGEDPRWSVDGKTIYYRNPNDRSVYAVSVRTEPQIEISEPRLLTDSEGDEWDVLPDERVVMVKKSDALEGARPDIRVILNWD